MVRECGQKDRWEDECPSLAKISGWQGQRWQPWKGGGWCFFSDYRKGILGSAVGAKRLITWMLRIHGVWENNFLTAFFFVLILWTKLCKELSFWTLRLNHGQIYGMELKKGKHSVFGCPIGCRLPFPSKKGCHRNEIAMLWLGTEKTQHPWPKDDHFSLLFLGQLKPEGT